MPEWIFLDYFTDLAPVTRALLQRRLFESPEASRADALASRFATRLSRGQRRGFAERCGRNQPVGNVFLAYVARHCCGWAAVARVVLLTMRRRRPCYFGGAPLAEPWM